MTITVTLYSFFEDSTNKDGETGLTVTVDVWRRTKADGTIAETVTAGSATEIGDGLYYYNVTSADPTLYDYLAVFKTASTDVVAKHVPAIRWDAAEGGVTVNSVLTAALALIWAYSSRTLTQSAASVAAAVSGSSITITRGDTLAAALTGVGATTDYVSIDFTLKSSPEDADTAALLRIRKNASATGDGLLIINGATAGTPTNGSITIVDAATGALTINLAAVESAKLAAADGLYYDIQYIFASSVVTKTSGVCNVSADVTRAVT